MQRNFLKTILLMAGGGMVLLMAALFLWQPSPVGRHENPDVPPGLDRMLELGPVGTNIVNSEYLDGLTITIKAARLWVKKSKTFGFDNNLFKKLAAKDFQLIIYNGDRKLIALSKPNLEMPFNRDMMVIEKPSIAFPPDLPQPDKVTLDKKNRRLLLRYANKEEIWDLTKI